jgi:hypothetical protein
VEPQQIFLSEVVIPTGKEMRFYAVFVLVFLDGGRGITRVAKIR